ncbi:MAG: hypothetical protein E4H14_11140 [Candidatus Thorarchaeota archaeon]|nr:MAG: hypothetical protein E4H14_11140 [Candidatus Thorarchaeota archaeon]
MEYSDTLPVKVWLSSEECEKGTLVFRSDDVILELDSGKIISGNNSGTDILFEIQDTSVVQSQKSNFRIRLKPHLMIQHPYTNNGTQFVEDIFPPSTAGFYGRMQVGKENALYSLHQIEHNAQFWLSISNPQTGSIFETHFIQPYEAEALSMVEDNRIRQALFMEAAAGRAKSREEILSILETPSPSGQELAKLIGDVSVPNLKHGKTMRETLSQIVPTSFPGAIRDELMVFLAHVIKSEIPEEDPLAYSFKYSATTLLENLLNGHLIPLFDGTDWPSYVKLMTLAERGQLDLPKRAISESVKNSPWLLFSIKCAEHHSSWLNIAISSAIDLNKSGKIVLGLPTTRSSAKRTRTAWKKRFAEMNHGLKVYGNLNPSSLGLAELVYIGAAYRWTHRHMKFITRLGAMGERAPHMQIMVVPVSVVEQIKRALPSTRNVVWSARTSNLNIFDTKLGKWDVSSEKLIESLEKRGSIKSLRKNFGENNTSEIYPLVREEAKTIDLVSEGVELSFLEIPEFLSNCEYNERRSRKIISNLTNRGLLKLTYEVLDRSLLSLAIIAQGKSTTITSVVSEFLKNTPTSYARLDETGENAVILTRLPEESVYDIASQLTSRGIEQDINIRCLRPTTFRRYTSNLYQRLLKDDGTWDDDVSAFLSQARSKRRELSESNA